MAYQQGLVFHSGRLHIPLGASSAQGHGKAGCPQATRNNNPGLNGARSLDQGGVWLHYQLLEGQDVFFRVVKGIIVVGFKNMEG